MPTTDDIKIKQMNERLDRFGSALGSNHLSGHSVTSERGKMAMESLLASTMEPDFNADQAKEDMIRALGLKQGA